MFRGSNITSFYGSSCVNNCKDALNTPSGEGVFTQGRDQSGESSGYIPIYLPFAPPPGAGTSQVRRGGIYPG
eukprot:1177266-Prorocentrum_minimum.AAC.4